MITVCLACGKEFIYPVDSTRFRCTHCGEEHIIQEVQFNVNLHVDKPRMHAKITGIKGDPDASEPGTEAKT